MHERSPRPIDPRHYARELIRPYVERGETVKELSDSMLGYAGRDYYAEIRKRRVFVDHIPGLAELHREILAEQAAREQGAQPRETQGRLC